MCVTSLSYGVLVSAWVAPTQPCAQSGKRRKRVTAQPDEVLFSTWALPTQPYSRHEKRRWRSRAHRSTITRLPSDASVSRSTYFRGGAFGVGAGTAHRCTGALAALRRIPAPRGPLRPLRGSLRSGNLIASRQAHSRFFRRKIAQTRTYAVAELRMEYHPSPCATPLYAYAQPRRP